MITSLSTVELSPEGAKDFIVRAQRGNGGVATGTLIFDSEDVLKLAPTQNVILCKNNLSWADEEAVKVLSNIVPYRLLALNLPQYHLLIIGCPWHHHFEGATVLP